MDVEKLFSKCTKVKPKHKSSYEKHQAKRQRKANTTEAMIPAAKKQLTIATLPLDVTRCLFDRLDAASSTSLGLTCKLFYNIHRRLHGTVELTTPFIDVPGGILADVLGDFFPDPWFSYEVKKFVPMMKYFEIKQQRFLGGISRPRELLDEEDQDMES